MSDLSPFNSVCGSSLGLDSNLSLGKKHKLSEHEVACRVGGVNSSTHDDYPHRATWWTNLKNIGQSSSEPVHIVDNKDIEQSCIEISEHLRPCSLWPTFLGSGDVIVAVVLNYRHAAPFRLSVASSYLLLDTLLDIDGLTGVYRCAKGGFGWHSNRIPEYVFVRT